MSREELELLIKDHLIEILPPSIQEEKLKDRTMT
jgi:hypothetical protein